MSPEEFQEVRKIFLQATARPAAERAVWVERACDGRPNLRSHVERLLQEDTGDGATETIELDRGGRQRPQGSAPRRGFPERVGQYRLHRVIASGGMGTVYEATQKRPRRTVAIKLMRAGFPSRSAFRRFEYESQILARLRHPNIAQVYEAGTHREGDTAVPYFAMEYIPEAQSITAYAARHKLGTRDRLGLFRSVCDAMHHGHQKGVIHRDLKPSNILVDADGHVKVIDFGVARATDSDVAMTTMQTDVGQLVGTLQFMSPEQCKADPNDIDTRSDVYGLGVVLYNLLSEQYPYDVGGMPIYEATRVIREQPPTRMSTHQRALKGDVETIVLKALEKERDRRYQSALELGQDIDRYLRGDPIVARPASTIYHLSVFTRRHKGIVAAVCALFVVLVSALIVTTSLYASAERARLVASSERQKAVEAQQLAEDEADNARAEAKKAEKVLQFLTTTINSAFPNNEGKEVTVRELIDRAAGNIAANLGDEPVVRGRVEGIFGHIYELLGRWDRAIKLGEASVATLREELGPDHIETLSKELRLIEAYIEAGNGNEAIGRLKSVLSVVSRSPRNDLDGIRAIALARLGNVLSKTGRMAGARGYFKQAAAILQSGALEQDSSAFIKMLLGRHYRLEGRYADAVQLLEESVPLREQTSGRNHPWTVFWKTDLAAALVQYGQPDEAVRWAVEAAEAAAEALSPTASNTLYAYDTLCAALRRLQRFDEAEAEALELLERHLAEPQSPDLVVAGDHARLLRIANWMGDTSRIEERATAYVTHLQQMGKRNPDQATALNSAAWQLLTIGPDRYRDPETALGFAMRAVELSNHQNAGTLDTLALAQSYVGDQDGALATESEALALLPLEVSTLRNGLERTLEQIYLARGDAAGMESYLRTLIEDRTREFGEKHYDTIRAWTDLAIFLARQGRHEEAAEIHKRLLGLVTEERGERCFDAAAQYGGYGRALLNLDKPDQAEAPLRESVALFTRYSGEKSERVAEFSSHLGDCLTRLGKFGEAEIHLLAAQEAIEIQWPRSDEHIVKNMQRLRKLYTKWAKGEPANAWAQRIRNLEGPQ